MVFERDNFYLTNTISYSKDSLRLYKLKLPSLAVCRTREFEGSNGSN